MVLLGDITVGLEGDNGLNGEVGVLDGDIVPAKSNLPDLGVPVKHKNRSVGPVLI